MPLPSSYQKLIVKKLTTDFRDAVEIQTADLKPPTNNQVLIKNQYVGVNATDINVTAGRYFCSGVPPYDIGFEGVGEVVAVGPGVKNTKIGQAVGYLCESLNAYAEYTYTIESLVFPVPEVKPEYVVPILSGLTSAIGLDKAGRIAKGETVLVTAAAGGAGHIAVQWAKAAGCDVIGMCSTLEKEKLLKNLGCSRVINYKTEDLDQVLSKEYPKGIDVIWETIGGKVFDTCLKHIAVKGRLILVGGISGYKATSLKSSGIDNSLISSLLMKSASLQGFLLLSYVDKYHVFFKQLLDKIEEAKIKPLVDCKTSGLDGIIDAVEYLHSGKSIGKVVVKIA